MEELVDEIVYLSQEFGILTEYTSFLAEEGTDLSSPDLVRSQAQANFVNRAQNIRSGLAAVNQDSNNTFQVTQAHLNASNALYDSNMNRVAITTIQQVNDMAFYNRNGRWIDSRLVERENEIAPDKVVEFGSAAFRQLAHSLAKAGRQNSVALQGDILLKVDGETILVKGPEARSL